MNFFCNNCGKEVDESSEYCNNCGVKVKEIKTEDSIKDPLLGKYVKSKKGAFASNRRLSYKTLGILAIVLIVCIIFYIQYSAAKKAEIAAANSAQEASQVQNQLTQLQQQVLQNTANTTNENAKVQSLLAGQNKPTVSSIVAKWQPIVAYVLCKYTDASGNTQEQSGSGTLIIKKDGSRSILTNYHVVSDGNGNYVSECAIKLPGDSTVYTAYNSNGDFTTTPDTADVAYISIDYPDTYLKDMTTDGRNYCSNTPGIGDEIVILGYPGVGSPTGVTATDGIISGFDGNYYVTSAKVEHGNSGGAAIDVANSCYLGIPTYVEIDSAGSLARVLKWQAF